MKTFNSVNLQKVSLSIPIFEFSPVRPNPKGFSYTEAQLIHDSKATQDKA